MRVPLPGSAPSMGPWPPVGCCPYRAALRDAPRWPYTIAPDCFSGSDQLQYSFSTHVPRVHGLRAPDRPPPLEPTTIRWAWTGGWKAGCTLDLFLQLHLARDAQHRRETTAPVGEEHVVSCEKEQGRGLVGCDLASRTRVRIITKPRSASMGRNISAIETFIQLA